MIEWHDLEEILPKVEKPGRYLGGEWNAVKKDPGEVEIKIALAFPDLYEVGMSYLGQKILYHILNAEPSILAERVFAPWPDFEHELRTRNMPLFSLENRIPLDRFDIIGFSLLYELNYSNILTMLNLGRIAQSSVRRDRDDPLVIAGGPAAFNPEPIADYFDLFVIGDGEEAFLEVIRDYISLKKGALDRFSIIKELSNIKGVYVPSLYSPYRPANISLMAVRPEKSAPAKIKKRVLYPFQETPFPENPVVPHVQVIFDRVAWEVARGCPQNCRFCQASSIYFPPRVKSPSPVIKGILNSLDSTGYESVSLASLSVGDYPYLERVIQPLMNELEKRRVSLALSSLRPKGLTSGIAENIVKVRKTGFTLVPEAGTERLRAVINKNLCNEEIWEATKNAFSQGWKRLKLYFMIGLPTEREEDLLGIVGMVTEIQRIGKRILNRSPQINLSISPFIPKPHTPFQWLRMEDEDSLERKFHYILSHLKEYPSIRLKRDSIKRSVLEGIFSRGDRRLIPVLHRAWEIGARFDSWNDMFRFPIWESAFDLEQIDFREYLGELDKDGVLPWDHIDTGLKKEHLLGELSMALEGKPSPSCMEKDCSRCLGCTLSKFYHREFDEGVSLVEKESRPLGESTENTQRYLASYRKIKQARYLSHMDMNKLIQQGFRRAKIPVLYSQGFHPKMLISYPPALPLGMTGREERIEFKSRQVIKKEEFLERIVPHMPDGVEFFDLCRLDEREPSLNKKIRAFVYSLDLHNEKVRQAMMNHPDRENTGEGYIQRAKKISEGFSNKQGGDTPERIYVDEKEGKLLLVVENPPLKGRKPQDIVVSMFGLENPVYLMARERILLDDAGSGSDSQKCD